MGYLQNKANQIVLDHVRANYTKISVSSGACRFNFRCADNAVHDAIEKSCGIAMCFYVENGYPIPIIHFINYDSTGYIDNTLGQWSSKCDYYLVKHIDKTEMWEIHTIFSSFRKEIRKLIPVHIRLFTDCTY